AFFLKLQARFLDVAQQAAKRPHWWMPGVSSDGRSMISLNVPSLGHVRDVCNALCARATLRAEEGDFDGFLADVGAAKRIGRHLSCGNVLIAQLVGYRIEMMADRCMCAWAALGGWRNEQCMAVRGVWSGLPALPPAAEVIDTGERWGALDLVMQSAQGPAGENPLLPFEDASGIGHGFEQGVNKGDVHWDTVLRRMNEQEDAMVAACSAPTFAEKRQKSRAVDDTLDQWGKDLPEHGLPRNAGESAEAYTERVARALCTTLLVRATPLLEFAQEQRTSDEMAQLMIACAWYKARENRWPAALADLVPSEIAKLPHDVFVSENAPIHYMATQKGACLRSVGRDGVEDAAGGSRRSRPDDIVLGASQAPGR
ncbi:MAG TPA: hypothetical protein VHM90_07470, partial [Phycisphaerae bacterium]|nr:hypothetical protein [Phycisphaerae bacterium]